MARLTDIASLDAMDSTHMAPKIPGGEDVKRDGVRLAMTFDDLLGDDDATDESASDMIRMAS